MTRFRPRGTRGTLAALAALAAGGAAVVGIVTIKAGEPQLPDPSVLNGQQAKQPVGGDASCDVDGVYVSYSAGYDAADPAGYKVTQADVEDVSPTCAGATVTVWLTSGAASLAAATVEAGGPSVTVPFSDAPPAGAVDGVQVAIAGGTVPVPAACDAITFDRYETLTLGDDTFAASKDNDLVYGLAGNDTITGGNKRDCLAGQAGDDVLDGQNHDDVVIGGDGDDTLSGGPGNDVLDGGPGTDTCIGGSGRNTFVSCEVRR